MKPARHRRARRRLRYLFRSRRIVGPVAELLAPLANAPRARSRCSAITTTIGNAGGAGARGFTVLKDQRTPLTIRGERSTSPASASGPARPPRSRSVLEGTGGTTHPARARSAPAGRSRRPRRAAGARPATPTAGRSCCRGRRGGGPQVSGACRVSAREDNTTIFVSRGVGTVYVPVRINCPPEVAVLTLRSAAEGGLTTVGRRSHGQPEPAPVDPPAARQH